MSAEQLVLQLCPSDTKLSLIQEDGHVTLRTRPTLSLDASAFCGLSSHVQLFPIQLMHISNRVNRRELLLMAAAVLLLHRSFGVNPFGLVGMSFLCTQVWCWWQAAQRKEYIAGHRAGAKGYTGMGSYLVGTVGTRMLLWCHWL